MFDINYAALEDILSGKTIGINNASGFSFEELERDLESDNTDTIGEIKSVIDSGDTLAEKVEEIEDIIAEETDEVVEAKDEEIAASEEAMEAYHDSMMVSMILGNESYDIVNAFGCESFGETVKSLWDKLVSFVKKVVAAIIAFFKGLWTSISNRFKGLSFWDKGRVKIDKVKLDSLVSHTMTIETLSDKVDNYIETGTTHLDEFRDGMKFVCKLKSPDDDDEIEKQVEFYKDAYKEDELKYMGDLKFLCDNDTSKRTEWEKHLDEKFLDKIFTPEGDKDSKKWPKGTDVAKAIVGAGERNPSKSLDLVKKMGKTLSDFSAFYQKRLEEMRGMVIEIDNEDKDLREIIRQATKTANQRMQRNNEVCVLVKKYITTVTRVLKKCVVHSQKSDWQA